MKILIVEDDTLLLQGLILAAQTEGYACDGVSTARMAEQSLEAGHYSLVVLDLGLPDIQPGDFVGKGIAGGEN